MNNGKPDGPHHSHGERVLRLGNDPVLQRTARYMEVLAQVHTYTMLQNIAGQVFCSPVNLSTPNSSVVGIGTTMDNAFIIPATAAEVVQGIAVEDFDDIVRHHQRRVYRVLYLLLGDAESADTLTQECFLRAYRKRKSFRGECRIDTWLLRIAVNLARDHRRNRRSSFWKRLVGLESEGAQAADKISDPRASPERIVLAQHQLQAVWAVAGTLPQQQRTIFLLRFAEDMTLAEISSVMGLRIGSVKAHLFRAIRTIRAALKEQWK